MGRKEGNEDGRGGSNRVTANDYGTWQILGAVSILRQDMRNGATLSATPSHIKPVDNPSYLGHTLRHSLGPSPLEATRRWISMTASML